MNKKKQYLVPATTVHKIAGSEVMIANTGEGLNTDISETVDPNNDPNNDSRRHYWNGWEE